MGSCKPDPLAADIVHVGEDRRDGADFAGRLGSPGGRVETFDKNLVDAIIGGKDLDCGPAELSALVVLPPPARDLWRHGSLCRSGIDDCLDLGNAVSGEASLAGVFANHFLVGRVVDAVDFVIGNVAMDPLDGGAKVAQNAA